MNAILELFKKLFIVKIITAVFIFFYSLTFNAQNDVLGIPRYKPQDETLFAEIIKLDSIYFTAYNNCDMAKQAALYSEDLEFFHDKGGLSTSKKELLKSIEKNICNKVTRNLVEGSVEVYPIPNYGAIEMGYHTFFNKEEPDAKQIPSRFIIVWKKEEKKWQIAKVISLH